MSEYIIDSGELYHYGVKGMKWGVRNDRKRSIVINGRKAPATRFDGQMDIKEMLAHKPKVKDAFGEVRTMMKIKTKDDIQAWSENEDAKIRDDLHYGKITRKEAERKWGLLASRTEYMLSALSGRRFVDNSHIMNLSIQQLQSTLACRLRVWACLEERTRSCSERCKQLKEAPTLRQGLFFFLFL